MTDKELNAEILRLSTKLIEAEACAEEMRNTLEQYAEFIEQGGVNPVIPFVDLKGVITSRTVALSLQFYLRSRTLEALTEASAKATAFADGVRRELALAMQEYSKRNLFPGSEGAAAAFKDFMKGSEK